MDSPDGPSEVSAGDSEPLALLAEFPHRALAEPILSLLHASGIPAILRLDDCGGLDPTGAFIYGARLFVPKPHETDAHALLAALRLEAAREEDTEP